jgi:ABC-type Fe3+-siderophore transport system permease subunit
LEENEILTSILGVVTAIAVIPLTRQFQFTGMLAFRCSVIALSLSYLCTNIEHVYAHDWFNIAEHLFLAIAAMLMLRMTFQLRRGKKTQ